MVTSKNLSGVFAAAVTPITENQDLDSAGLTELLEFLVNRGCHGALLMGTTGEGPSFSPEERFEICQQAAAFRSAHPEFAFLVGTGTPSLSETIALTKVSFDAGLDGVVVLPPYYYKKVNEQGLFDWYSQVIRKAVPGDGKFFGYHIPAVSGVGLPLDLIARLLDAFPGQFVGIKDSTGDPDFARALGARFGSDLIVFTGNDSMFSTALQNHASGCITALANLYSPVLRQLWDAFQTGQSTQAFQDRIAAARAVSDRYAPAPALLKMMLHQSHGLPAWPVRPPLTALSLDLIEHAQAEFSQLG